MPDEIVKSVLVELEILKNVNNRRANLSLIGLAIVFLLSLSFFLFSDYLAPKANLSDEKDIFLYEQETKKNLEALSLSTGDAMSDIKLYGKKELSNSEKKRLLEIEPEAKLAERLDNINRQKNSLLKELDLLQNRRLSALNAGDSKSIETIIATSITRVGAVLLSVFMMQILLGFFRFFIRLSNYYSAKLIALKALSENDAEGISKVVNSIEPENINFGKEPQMPFDKVFELLKATK